LICWIGRRVCEYVCVFVCVQLLASLGKARIDDRRCSEGDDGSGRRVSERETKNVGIYKNKYYDYFCIVPIIEQTFADSDEYHPYRCFERTRIRRVYYQTSLSVRTLSEV